MSTKCVSESRSRSVCTTRSSARYQVSPSGHRPATRRIFLHSPQVAAADGLPIRKESSSLPGVRAGLGAFSSPPDVAKWDRAVTPAVSYLESARELESLVFLKRGTGALPKLRLVLSERSGTTRARRSPSGCSTSTCHAPVPTSSSASIAASWRASRARSPPRSTTRSARPASPEQPLAPVRDSSGGTMRDTKSQIESDRKAALD